MYILILMIIPLHLTRKDVQPHHKRICTYAPYVRMYSRREQTTIVVNRAKSVTRLLTSGLEVVAKAQFSRENNVNSRFSDFQHLAALPRGTGLG